MATTLNNQTTNQVAGGHSHSHSHSLSQPQPMQTQQQQHQLQQQQQQPSQQTSTLSTSSSSHHHSHRRSSIITAPYSIPIKNESSTINGGAGGVNANYQLNGSNGNANNNSFSTSFGSHTGGPIFHHNHGNSQSSQISQSLSSSVPMLSREFVVRRISEGETGRLKEELKCEACGKGYKHISSLAKHLWEHTPEWNMTKKLLISKHQQVQLLEAASILCSINENQPIGSKSEEEQSTSNNVMNSSNSSSSIASPLSKETSVNSSNNLSSTPTPNTTPAPISLSSSFNNNNNNNNNSINNQNNNTQSGLLSLRKSSISQYPPSSLGNRKFSNTLASQPSPQQIFNNGNNTYLDNSKQFLNPTMQNGSQLGSSVTHRNNRYSVSPSQDDQDEYDRTNNLTNNNNIEEEDEQEVKFYPRENEDEAIDDDDDDDEVFGKMDN